MNRGYEYLDGYKVSESMHELFEECYNSALEETIKSSPLVPSAKQLMMVLCATSVPCVIFTSLPLQFVETLFRLLIISSSSNPLMLSLSLFEQAPTTSR